MTFKERTPEENKKLIEEFPFLLPRNVWSGKVPDDYNYEYTALDTAEMSDAWIEKLLLPMCREIKEELIRAEAERTDDAAERKRFARWYSADTKDIKNDDYLHLWQITQTKEKFGSLRLYCNFYTDNMMKIIHKYEKISDRTCYFCGKRATLVSEGYILPYCAKCAKEKQNITYIPIKTWLKGED